MDEINDKRAKFKGITFSKYKKSDVKQQLLKSIMYGKVEQTCYWAAEYICAGHYKDLWDAILLLISKNIHIANPKLPIYIDMRFQHFKQIVQNGYIGNELSLRNNLKIRKLFAEICSVLCLSGKKNSLDTVKIQKEEFDISNIPGKLHAMSIVYAQSFFKKGDPTEIYIALNEMAYNITIKNTIQVWYWIEWIIEFDKICSSKKKGFKIVRREKIPVESKFQMETIWIVWDALFYYAKKEIEKKIMNSLLNLFCIHYSPNAKTKRKMLLYFAAYLLTENYNMAVPIISDKNTVEMVVNNINATYKQIKKNEEAPSTDYLFNNSFTNSDKTVKDTINKIEKMNQIGLIRKL